jgi:TRAP-type C4-dicarboxylate transport system permease small subunit
MSEEARDSGGRPEGRLVRLLESTLGFAAGAMLFALMTITVVDVVGRYALNAPLPAGYELIQLGMALLVFLTLPILSARDEQVRVDIFERILPARVRPALRVASAAISLVVVAAFAWLLWARGSSFVASGETTSNLRLPQAPFAFFIAASWAASAAIILLRLLRWRAAAGGGGR